MSLALTGKKKEQAEEFYGRLLKILIDKKLPFVIGGTYAFNNYVQLDRPTGDIDIKCTTDDYPKILKTLSKAGYKTELAEMEFNWLAKVYDEKGFYTDIIFGDRSNNFRIGKSWLEYARDGSVLGHSILLEPIEEMIKSKALIQGKLRDDGFDVMLLFLRQGKNINWERLLNIMTDMWEILLARIINFYFVYPSERDTIPRWVIDSLIQKLQDVLANDPPKEKVTRGLMLAPEYEVGISQWGFKPVKKLK